MMHEVTFMPYLIKKGLELFEIDGAIPLSDEPQQAHDQDLFDLQYESTVMCQEERTALVYPVFLR